MEIDENTRQQYENEMAALIKSQQDELKKKMNPLFAKMHAMSPEEVEELRQELLMAHEGQKKDLARRYGIPYEG